MSLLRLYNRTTNIAAGKEVFLVHVTGSLMQSLFSANAQWQARAVTVAPDGDVDVDENMIESFQAPHCANCRAVKKLYCHREHSDFIAGFTHSRRRFIWR